MCHIFGMNAIGLGINQNFSLDNNISELQSLSRAQSQLSFFIGNIVGMYFSMKNIKISFRCFNYILMMYNATAFLALKYVTLDFLNLQRAFILCENYHKNGIIPNIEELNKKENLFFNKFEIPNIHFANFELNKIINELSLQEKQTLIKCFNLFKDEKFTIFYRVVNNKIHLYTVLKKDVDNEDILYSFLFTYELNLALAKLERNRNFVLNFEVFSKKVNRIKINKEDFINGLKAEGYKMNGKHLEQKYSRYNLV